MFNTKYKSLLGYKKKVFVIFFLVFSILFNIILMSFFYNAIIKESIIQEKNIEKNFSNYANNINRDLDAIFQQYYMIKSSNIIQNFNYSNKLSAYDELQMHKHLQSTFFNLVNKDSFIAFLDLNTDKVFSTSGIFNLHDYVKKLYLTKEELTTVFNTTSSNSLKNKKYLLSYEEDIQKGYLNIVFIENDSFDMRKLGIISININNFYGYMSNTDESFYIYSKDLLISPLNKNPNKNILGYINENSINTYTRIDKNLSVYHIFPSSLMDLYFIFENQSHTIQKILFYIFTFIVLCIFVLYLAYKLALYISDKIYLPISNLMSTIGDYSVDEFTKDEFDFIKEKINTVTILKKELDENIENNTQILREKFLKDYLLGIVKPDNFQSRSSLLNIEYNKNPLHLVLIDYSSLNEDEDLLRSLRAQLRAELNNSKIVDVLALDIYESVAIFNIANTNEVKEHMSTAISKLNTAMENPMSILVSEPIMQIKSLPKIYKLLKYVSDYKSIFITTSDNIALYRDIKDIKLEYSYYYPLFLEQKLINSVVRAERESVDEILDELLNENFKKRYLNNHQKKELVFSITSTIRRIMHQFNETPENIFSNNNVYELLKAKQNSDSIVTYILDVFNELVKYIETKKSFSEDDIKIRLLNYIQQNYSSDIGLEDIAKEFNITPKYSSLLIKRLLNRNFKDVLNGIRINEAKKLLSENKNIKINEVAKKVGFNNSNTFIRVFKKYVGTSPGLYSKDNN